MIPQHHSNVHLASKIADRLADWQSQRSPIEEAASVFGEFGERRTRNYLRREWPALTAADVDAIVAEVAR